jgi:signal transduction histidine kinase
MFTKKPFRAIRALEKLFRLHPGKALAALFAITVVVPGLLLAIFGLQSIRQERRTAEQKIRDQLDSAADRAMHEIEREIRSWQDVPGQVDSKTQLASLPDKIRHAMDTVGESVLILRGQDGFQAYPQKSLLYWPVLGNEAEPPLPPVLEDVENYELRTGEWANALEKYQALLKLYPQNRSWIMQRIARVNRNLGRNREAKRNYQQLINDSTRIDGLPADLISLFELCSMNADQSGAGAIRSSSLQLYRDLVDGRWRLDRFQYLSFSETISGWIGEKPEPLELAELRSMERKKSALSHAVEELLKSPRSFILAEPDPIIAYWRADPFAAVLISGRLLAERTRSTISPGAEGFDFLLFDANGKLIDSKNTAPLSEPSVHVRLEPVGLPWQLRVQPHRSDTLYASLALQRKFYIAVVLTMVAVILSGGYLMMRTVRREVEIARLKSDFVSAVSHEFRSPLTGIRHVGELLREGRVKSETRREEYYSMICRESDRLSRLVENLLDFSRMEEGKKKYLFEDVEISKLLRELVADFQEEAEIAGVTVQAEIPDCLPFLKGDREALMTAVRNLLENAVKYSPDFKNIWISARAADSWIEVQIRDEGIGISDGDRERIFEKFYRAGGDATRNVKGVGLGLALVSHVVNAHGGRIQVKSKLGEGSEFTIFLPVKTPLS